MAQNFFIALLLFLALKFDQWDSRKLAAALPLTIGLAIWSSEISLAAAAVFVIVFYTEVKICFKKRNLIYAGLSFIGTFAFIAWAKAIAKKTNDFNTNFTSLNNLMEGFDKLLHYFVECATFSSNKPPNAYLFYGIIVLVLLLILFRKSVQLSRRSKFFLYSSILSFLLIVLSSWWNVSNYALRYFTFSYLTALLFFISIVADNQKHYLKLLLPLTLVVSFSGWSGIYLLTSFSAELPHRPTPKEMHEIAGMGDFGIIGTYWFTYAIDALSEDIETSPFNTWAIRNPNGFEKVFEKDSIMLIRNQFLKELPDTSLQFGHKLLKISPNQKLGRLEYAFYEEIKP